MREKKRGINRKISLNEKTYEVNKCRGEIRNLIDVLKEEKKGDQ